MIALRYTLLVLAGVSFTTVFMTGIVNGVALIGLIALAGAAATSTTVQAWVGALVAEDRSADRTVFDILDRPAPRHVAPDECDCAVDHGEAGYDADRTAS
ncbi:MAG: hypothetical protein ACTMIY_11990 [Microbacterium gubbeenense]